MNQYNLEIKEHNKQAHIDIETEIQRQKNGLFTFILRVDNGNIVDFNVVEYADIRKYLVLKKIVIEEFSVTPYPVNGGQQNPLRSDNGQRTAQGFSSTTGESQYSQIKKEEV